MRVSLLIFVCFVNWSWSVNVGNAMKSAFNSLGTYSNYTNAGIYQSQSGGYMMGGNLQMRTASNSMKLVHLQLPHLHADICALDMFGGAISYISKEEFVNGLKNLAQGAVSYSFLLAMQVMVPSVKGIMAEVERFRNMANSLSLNGCRDAHRFLNGMVMSNQALSTRVCEGVSDGYDYLSVQRECRKRTRQKQAIEDAKRRQELNGIVLGNNYNVAWMAINNHPYLKTQSLDLKHFYMSLTGTLIVYDADKGGDENVAGDARIKPIPSLIEKNNLLHALMYGGEAKIFGCNDNTDCLNINENITLKIEPQDSMVGKAEDLLKKFAGSIRTDVPMDSPEQTEVIAFLEGTRLPILKMLYVNIAATRGMAPLHAGKYAEWVAYDILYEYLLGIFNDLIDSATRLKAVQLDPTKFQEFLVNLQKAKQAVISKRFDLYQSQQLQTAFAEETRLLERQLATSIDIKGA